LNTRDFINGEKYTYSDWHGNIGLMFSVYGLSYHNQQVLGTSSHDL